MFKKDIVSATDALERMIRSKLQAQNHEGSFLEMPNEMLDTIVKEADGEHILTSLSFRLISAKPKHAGSPNSSPYMAAQISHLKLMLNELDGSVESHSGKKKRRVGFIVGVLLCIDGHAPQTPTQGNYVANLLCAKYLIKRIRSGNDKNGLLNLVLGVVEGIVWNLGLFTVDELKGIHKN